MRREVELAAGRLVAYGHWGRPLLVFPSQGGDRWEWERHGMVAAIDDLLAGGRVKLYCVDTLDAWSWHDDSVPLEERARRHGVYEDWITTLVAPWIRNDSGGAAETMVAGTSFGAYHAANFALKHADLFPLSLCFSGVYDVTRIGWGERGDAVYFNNPADYVVRLHGDHLDWLREHVSILLVVGRGTWEESTGALESTRRFAAQLDSRGIRHELDVWSEDVPHDWPSWQAQLAHHLPRFC
jgi:esterase/lipase superfamily enzyme